MIKALFFDIDGTLVSFKTHKIPQSTIEAISMAKSRGTKIFISTGRPYSLINNIAEIRHLVDGYITTNGAFCFIGNHIISCNPIPREDVATVIRLSDEMNFACMVVGEKDLAMYHKNKRSEEIMKLLNVHGLKDGTPIEPILQQRILQLTPIITEVEEQQIMQQLHGCISSRWCPDFADITAYNADKGQGLLSIIGNLGIATDETMAFGDGGNDIPIIKIAGAGIAMGNANNSLKAVADYVTTTVDENGIFNALKHYGII